MKKLMLLGGLLTALAAPAYAGPSAPGWGGFYAGSNVGYGLANSGNDWNVFARGAGGLGPMSCPTTPGGQAFCAAGSDSTKLKGLMGGLQIGYNWQSGNFLTGIVTDFDFSGQKGSNNLDAPFPINPAPGIFSASYTEKLAWLGTLRGKLGVTADRSLFYATGGLAYGRVNVKGAATATVDFLPTTPPAPFASWDESKTKLGWAIGAGMEQSIDRNWSLSAEYLHVDLGTVSTSFDTIPGFYGSFGVASLVVHAGTGTINSRITDNILRLAINYRFD